MKTKEFDERFDNGESVLPFADMAGAERPNLKTRRLNVDVPAWMAEALDREAARRGVSCQSLLRRWLSRSLTDASARP